MFEFDAASGSLAIPVWIAAALAAAIVVLAVFAIARAGAVRTVVSLAVLAALGYAGWLAWLVTDRASAPGASGLGAVEERRLFDARVTELVGRAMAPGSPLACLDGNAGDQVAAGCEKVIFASPDTVAAAVSYLSSRLALMNEGAELAAASGLNYDRPINTLRQGLEADRYGLVAYVLLQNPDCKPERCETLATLRDPEKVRVNLLEKPFDVLVARYAASWQSGNRNPVGSAGAVSSIAPPPPATSGQGVPVSSRYDFPSASSIPPVSIMNAEPAGSPAQAAASPEAKATPDAKPAAAPKPAPKRVAAPKPPARREAAAPTQLAPAQTAAPTEAQERPAAQQQ